MARSIAAKLQKAIKREVAVFKPLKAEVVFSPGVAWIKMATTSARVAMPMKPSKYDHPSAIGRVRRALGRMAEEEKRVAA